MIHEDILIIEGNVRIEFDGFGGFKIYNFNQIKDNELHAHLLRMGFDYGFFDDWGVYYRAFIDKEEVEKISDKYSHLKNFFLKYMD